MNSDKYEFAVPSPVRVCFTGKNRAGSWEIRGRQMAACRSNWYGSQSLTEQDLENFDIFCFVKRPVPELVHELRHRGKIVVFDVVDSWAQPKEGLEYTDLAGARTLFAEKWKDLPFHAFIFPNRTMMQDLRHLARHSTYLYHHFRPGLEMRPLREKVTIIGYEGNASYLGHWKDVLENYCFRHDIHWSVNPDDYAALDIGVAVRGGEHDSFLANRYKSNVKLANFYGAGIPCVISSKERSCHETDEGSVAFFSTEEQLVRQLDRLMSLEIRKGIRERFSRVREHFRIERLAEQYERFFIQLLHKRDRGYLDT